MGSERTKRSWREIDRAKDGSYHRSEHRQRAQRQEQLAQANITAKQHRMALEALFAPKGAADKNQTVAKTIAKVAPRIVLAPNPDADPKHQERQRLLALFLAASGPAGITRAADAFFEAGFVLPEDQDAYVQLLEHSDERRVQLAIDKLSHILAGQLPKRRPIIEQRLRRIEDQAENLDTRQAAAALRRSLHGRGSDRKHTDEQV